MPPLLSIRETAAALSISVDTVYRLVNRRALGAVRIGGQLRVPPAELDRITQLEPRP